MPSGRSWLSFLFVNLAFALSIVAIVYVYRAAQIESKWPLYQCNPFHLFLADGSWRKCARSIQSYYIEILWMPVTYITRLLHR